MSAEETLRAVLAERFPSAAGERFRSPAEELLLTVRRPAVWPRPLSDGEASRNRRRAGEALDHVPQDYRRGRRAA